MWGKARQLCAIRRHQTASLDHLVGKLLELRWHIEAKCRAKRAVQKGLPSLPGFVSF
jgi:hypothetical protein